MISFVTAILESASVQAEKNQARLDMDRACLLYTSQRQIGERVSGIWIGFSLINRESMPVHLLKACLLYTSQMGV